MSLYNEDLRDAIMAYLQSEFPTFNIEEQLEEESYCFRLTSESSSYFLRVMYSVTQGLSKEEMLVQFEQFAVASTMRSLGDFPVVVTEQGCMFGSP